MALPPKKKFSPNLKNLDWQHIALTIAGVVTLAGPDVAKALYADGFPAVAGDITHAVGFVTLLLALLKASPSAPASVVDPDVTQDPPPPAKP